jgi:hypothetical protein
MIILGSLTYSTATVILVPNKAMAQATASLPDDECLFEPGLQNAHLDKMENALQDLT